MPVSYPTFLAATFVGIIVIAMYLLMLEMLNVRWRRPKFSRLFSKFRG